MSSDKAHDRRERFRNLGRLHAGQSFDRVLRTFTDDQLKDVMFNPSAFERYLEESMVRYFPRRSDTLVVEVDCTKDFFQLMEKAGLSFGYLPYMYKEVWNIPPPQFSGVISVEVVMEDVNSPCPQEYIKSRRLEFCHPLVLPSLSIQFPGEIKGRRLFTQWLTPGKWSQWGCRLSITNGAASVQQMYYDREVNQTAVTSIFGR